MEEFGRVCRRMKLKANAAMCKVMRFGRDGVIREMNIVVDGQELEDVEVIKFLGSLLTAEKSGWGE